MILEGIVTTRNPDDSTNISPMGPMVDGPGFDAFVLRPYQSSTTYQNLKRHGEGVLHVTDDVLLIARGAIGKLTDSSVPLKDAQFIRGRILLDACHWYAFQVQELLDVDERTTIYCRVIERRVEREFFGFCRAKHAVIEAAILATRTQFLPAEQIVTEFERLKVIVDKTAGVQERQAFDLLHAFVSRECEEK